MPLLLAMVLFACSPPVGVGDPAPEFVLTGLDGDTVHLRDLYGRIVLLHFWATWCPPCITELPQLEGFMKTAYSSRATLIAVCVDNAKAHEVRRFLDSWGFSLPVYLDPGGRLARKFGTFRYPETYILDEQGVVRKKIRGAADWTSPEWVQFLQNISPPRPDGLAR